MLEIPSVRRMAPATAAYLPNSQQCAKALGVKGCGCVLAAARPAITGYRATQIGSAAVVFNDGL
jgi:hypothetical protein